VGAKPDKYGFLPSEQALFVLADAREIETSASLNKGAHIILTGKFASIQGGTIMLTDCSYQMSGSK
jgi:hypothetical protein